MKNAECIMKLLNNIHKLFAKVRVQISTEKGLVLAYLKATLYYDIACELYDYYGKDQYHDNLNLVLVCLKRVILEYKLLERKPDIVIRAKEMFGRLDKRRETLEAELNKIESDSSNIKQRISLALELGDKTEATKYIEIFQKQQNISEESEFYLKRLSVIQYMAKIIHEENKLTFQEGDDLLDIEFKFCKLDENLDNVTLSWLSNKNNQDGLLLVNIADDEHNMSCWTLMLYRPNQPIFKANIESEDLFSIWLTHCVNKKEPITPTSCIEVLSSSHLSLPVRYQTREIKLLTCCQRLANLYNKIGVEQILTQYFIELAKKMSEEIKEKRALLFSFQETPRFERSTLQGEKELKGICEKEKIITKKFTNKDTSFELSRGRGYRSSDHLLEAWKDDEVANYDQPKDRFYLEQKKNNHRKILKSSERSSLSSQVIMVRQMQTVTGTRITTRTFSSNSSLSEELSVKKVQGLNNASLEKIPDLLDKGTHLRCDKSHIENLNILLKLAQDKDSSQEFTQKELNYVLQCSSADTRPFSALSVFEKDLKIVRLTIKILSCLAQNKRLTKSAMNILFKKLDDPDEKIFLNATIALSYAINYGQDLFKTPSDEKSCIKKIASKIRGLANSSEALFHLTTRAVGLAAIAKKGEKLSGKDLKFLKETLTYVQAQKKHSFFSRTLNTTDYYPKSRISFFKTTLSELKNLKNIARSGEPLAAQELTYSIRRWHDENDTKKKRKSIQILRYAIQNKQRNFVEKDKAIVALQDGSGDNYGRKIKSNAIIGLGHLVANAAEKDETEVDLKPYLNKALTETRQHGLSALSFHIQRHGSQSLADAKEWLEVLNILKEDESQRIRNSARFIEYSINDNASALEELLLSEEHAVEVTFRFSETAEEKSFVLSKKVLYDLKKIMLGQYHFDAKYNSIVILKCVAENGHEIPEEVLNAAVDFVLKNSDIKIWNVVCCLLGFYAARNIKPMLHKPVFELLSQALKDKEKAYDASFAVKNIIQNLGKVCHNDEFLNIFYIAAQMIAKEVMDAEVKRRLALILLHAAQKGFVFTSAILDELAIAITRKNSEEIIPKILEAIKFLLKNSEHVVITENLAINLVELLKADSDIIKSDATWLLSAYIEKEKSLPMTSILHVEKLLSDPVSSEFATEILRKIVQRGWPINLDCLGKLSEALTHESTESRINAAWILNELIEKHALDEKILINLCNAIGDTENEAAEYTISVLKKVILQNPGKIYLPKKVLQKLSEIVNDFDQKIDIRENACKILKQHCGIQKNVRFLSETIDTLKEALNCEDTHLCKMIIEILNFQIFNYRENFHDQEIIEVLKKLEEMMDNQELFPETILFLKQAHQRGYVLSENTLEILADILLTHVDKDIRMHVKEIFITLKETKTLSKRIVEIKKLESSGSVLADYKKARKDRFDAIRLMRQIVEKGQFLSKNNLLSFIELIHDININKDLLNEILYVTYSVSRNGQKLPDSLLAEIVNIMKVSDGKTKQYAARSLCMVAKKGDHIPEDVFSIFESLVVNDKNIEIFEDYFIVIDLAIKKGKKLEKNTVLAMIALLKNKSVPIQMKNVVSRTIYSAAESQQNFYFIVEEIIGILKASSDLEVVKFLNLTLKAIASNENLLLSQNALKDLDEILKVGHSVEVEEDILGLLTKQHDEQKLSKETIRLMEIRKQEHILMDDKNEIEKRIQAAESLKLYGKYLSNHAFKSFESLLKSFNVKVQNSMLASLSEIQQAVDLPESTLELVAVLLNKTTSDEIIFSLLSKGIMLEKKVSVVIVENLIDAMLTHVNPKAREVTFNLLKNIQKHQKLNGQQAFLISLEEQVSFLRKSLPDVQYEKVQSLLRKFKAKTPISINNFMFLIEVLHLKNHSLHKVVIDQIFKLKDQIHSSCHEYFLEVLIKINTNAGFNESKIMSVCIFLLRSANLQSSAISKMIGILEEKLNGKKVNSRQLHLLKTLIEMTSEPVSDKLMESLLNSLLVASDEEKQLELVCFLFTCVKRNSVFSENTHHLLKNAIAMVLGEKPEHYLPLVDGDSFGKKIIYSDKVKIQFFKVLSYAYRFEPNNFKEPVNLLLEDIIENNISKMIGINKSTLDKINSVECKERINIFLTLLSVDCYDANMFDSYVNDFEKISREILCIDLLFKSTNINNDTDSAGNKELFYQYLADLENSKKYSACSYERDNILSLLIERQEKNNLNLYDINQLLVVLKNLDEPSIQALTRKDEDLKCYWFRKEVRNFLNSINVSVENIEEILFKVEKINWPAELIEGFLLKIKDTRDINLLSWFLGFCIEYEINENFLSKLFKCNVNNACPLNEWMLKLKKEAIAQKLFKFVEKLSEKEILQKNLYKLNSMSQCLLKRISKLLDIGWSFEKISNLLEKFVDKVQNNSISSFEHLQMLFDLAYCYEFSENEFYENAIYEPGKVINVLHKKGIEKHFKNLSPKKKLPILFSELKKDNKENQFIQELLDSSKLTDILTEMKNQYIGGCNLRLMYSETVEHRDAIIQGREIAVLMSKNQFEILCRSRKDDNIIRFTCSEVVKKELLSLKIDTNDTQKLLVKDESTRDVYELIYKEVTSNKGHASIGSLLSKYQSPKPIWMWDEKDIKKWAIHIKSHAREEPVLPEILAVIKRACFLGFSSDFHIQPRKIQILSVLIFLYCDPQKGRLAEIATGEGKSLIVAILATIRALRGELVDIVTSSAGLAKRDVDEYRNYYQLFNLKTDHNEDKKYTRGLKKCYAKDVNIVYGYISDFQFDILRDEYEMLGTRGGRSFDRVIVDEVDNLLIDEGARIAMLARTIPGIDSLKNIFNLIAAEFERIKGRFLFEKDACYYQEGDPSSEFFLIKNIEDFIEEKLLTYVKKIISDGCHIRLMLNEIGGFENAIKKGSEIIITTNNNDELVIFYQNRTNGGIDNFTCSKDLKALLLPLTFNGEILVKNQKSEELYKLIYEEVTSKGGCIFFYNKTLVPPNFQNFVKVQTPKWIKNIMVADRYKVGIQYKIERDQNGILSVMPIDFRNTGDVQIGTTWGDGLQQFLQIKHGLEVGSESLIVNFISNMAYIKRYKNKLYGVTGTLGSKEAQNLLADQETYNIDFAHIPTYKAKQFRELPAIVTCSKSEWMNEIEASALREAKNGRVVLIICETMKRAEKVRKIFIQNYKKLNIKLYIENKDESARFLKNNLEGGTIIVATNVAGRGTDIKMAPEVIERGGLHVCFTYLASNLRVELQGFGRASRSGAPGTAQLVFTERELLMKLKLSQNELVTDFSSLDIKKIKAMRDNMERENLKQFKEHDLCKTKIKDELYENFLDLLRELIKLDASEISSYKRKAVEERWGIWLKEINDNEFGKELIEKFSIFREMVLSEYKSDSVIKNPYYYINYGDYLLKYDNSIKGKIFSKFASSVCQHAIEAFDKAIELDPVHAYMAYYNILYALIKTAKNNYKEKAKHYACIFIKVIGNDILPQIMAVEHLVNAMNRCGEVRVYNELSHQLSSKIHTLHTLTASCYQIIQEIEISQKLIDISFETSDGVTSFNKLDKSQALDKSQELNGISDLNQNLALSFHGLGASSGNYQAKNTIEKANENVRITIIFKGGNDKDKLKRLLPINRGAADFVDKEEKEIKELEKLTEDNDKEKISFRDHLDDFSKKTKNLVNKTGSKLKSVVAPVTKKYENMKDNWHGYKESEKVPVSLSIEYLSFNEAIKTLREIKEKDVNITLNLMRVEKSFLRSILNGGFSNLTFYSHSVNVDESSEVVTNQKIDNPQVYEGFCTVSFKNLSIEEILSSIEKLSEILKKSKEISINYASAIFEFSKLTQKNAEKIIDSSLGQITISFKDLKKEEAIKIIYLAECYNKEATFKITNLGAKEAKYLIDNADRKEEGFEISIKPIEDVILRLKNSKIELSEYLSNGFIHLLEIKEKNPIPWTRIAVVTVLGVTQIAAGILLLGTTFGAASGFGIVLIAEGIGDLMKAATAAYSREFSWATYTVQKSISLAIGFATAGYAAYQLSNVGAELLDDVAMQSALVIKRTLLENGLKTGARQLLGKTVESGARMAAGGVIDFVGNYGMEQLKPTVLELINHEMKIRIQNGAWKETLNKLCAIDLHLRNKFLFNGSFSNDIVFEAKHIIETMQIEVLALNGISANTFLEFDRRFTEALRRVDSKIPSFERLLYEKLKPSLTIEQAQEICNILRNKKILTSENSINFDSICSIQEMIMLDEDHFFDSTQIDDKKLASLDFGIYENYKSAVINACKDFILAMQEDYFIEKRMLREKISGLFSEQFNKAVKLYVDVVKKGISMAANTGISMAATAINQPPDSMLGGDDATVKDQSVPGSNVHGHAQNVHGRAPNVHGHASNVHGHAPNVHGHAPNVHGHGSNVHGRAPDVYGHVPNVQGHVPNVHGRAPNVHGHASNIHGHAPNVHGHAPNVHGHGSNVHGRAPDVYGHVPNVQGHVPNVHGHAPNVHAHAPNVHGHASNVHGHAPNVHAHAPNVHGHAPNVHGHAPNVHAHVPNVHGRAPDVYGHVPNVHGRAPNVDNHINVGENVPASNIYVRVTENVAVSRVYVRVGQNIPILRGRGYADMNQNMPASNVYVRVDEAVPRSDIPSHIRMREGIPTSNMHGHTPPGENIVIVNREGRVELDPTGSRNEPYGVGAQRLNDSEDSGLYRVPVGTEKSYSIVGKFHKNHLRSHLFSKVSSTQESNVSIIFLRIIPLTAVQEGILNQYKMELKKLYAEKEYLLKRLRAIYNEKNRDLLDKILSAQRKIIKMLVEFILIQKTWSSSFDSENKTAVAKLDNIRENLFDDCMRNHRNGYNVVIENLNKISLDHEESSDFLFELKESFVIFNQLLEESKMAKSSMDMISGLMDKIDPKEVMGKYFEYVDNKQYSECGKLLRSGHLGEKGYIAGELMQGMFSANKLATQNHHQVQLMLGNLAREVVAGQTQFETNLVGLQKKYAELTIKIEGKFGDKLKEINAISEKYDTLIEQGMTDRSIDVAKFVAASEYYKSRSEHQTRQLEAYYNASTAVVKANAIDPQFVKTCMEMRVAITKSITEAITAIGKEQSSGVQALISASKEIVFKMIENKQGANPQVDTKANQEQQALPAPAQLAQHQKALPAPVAQFGQNEAVAQPAKHPDQVEPWKQKLSKADEFYKSAKAKLKVKKDPEAAYVLFSDAKTLYKEIKEVASGPDKAKAETRFDKIKTGKYSKLSV